MVDVAAKCRHSVLMALAARALSEGAYEAHRKRVLARYCFVFLHEFIAIAACWRNRLNRDPCTRWLARAALPALDRLRTDWTTYEPVRHHLAAKRREADPDRTADLNTTVALWGSIRELSVTVLVDDAIEVFELLAQATPHLAPIDDARIAPRGVTAALRSLVVPGSHQYREASVTTYAPARPGTMPLTAGGELGRRIRQVNDVMDHLATLRAVAPVTSHDEPFAWLVRSALAAEMSSLLDLSIGPPPGVNATMRPLTTLCDELGAQVGAETLHKLGCTIHAQTRRDIRYCRNKYGAHIDPMLPIDELQDLLNVFAVEGCLSLLDHITDWLEAAGCSELALYPLLFDGRLFASFPRDPMEPVPAPYALTTGDDPRLSAAPPEHADAPYVLWVGGHDGHLAAPAVAGALAGRARCFTERQPARQGAQLGSNSEPSGSVGRL